MRASTQRVKGAVEKRGRARERLWKDVDARCLSAFLSRHARPRAGHPRFVSEKKNVDGRGKPGHDGNNKGRFVRNAPSRLPLRPADVYSGFSPSTVRRRIRRGSVASKS